MAKTETAFHGFDLVLGMMFFVILPSSVLLVPTLLDNGDKLLAIICSLVGGTAFVGLVALTRIHEKKKTDYRSWKIGMRFICWKIHWMLEKGFNEEVSFPVRCIALVIMSLMIIFFLGGLPVLTIGAILAIIF